MEPNFKGRQELVSRLDRAVCGSSVEEVTHAVQDILVDVANSQAVELPAELKVPAGDRYARRLLYRSDEHGYVVIAMIWGPGQGTPVHDHAGVWCVEGVLEGEIDVVRYDLREEDGRRCRFEALERLRADVGSAGSLIPPFEYHTIHNARSDESSITVHVYGRELVECSIFVDDEAEGWYRRESRTLSYN